MALIQIVDENDVPTRGATKQEAWEEGLIHRLVRVLVEDEDGRILLQRRPATMKLSPNMWDISVAGHVDEGEDYETAAKRELQEELGVEAALAEVDAYKTSKVIKGRKINRFNKVFRAARVSASEVNPDEREIAEIRWLHPKELRLFVEEHSDQLTDGLKHVAAHYY